MNNPKQRNVLGGPLRCCCIKPKTGFYRDGFCTSGPEDYGRHLVCAVVTERFLDFSRNMGNDLITPRPNYDFPGLKPGDKWCLCVLRWMEAWQAGIAPMVVLEATHNNVLDYVDLGELQKHAIETEA